MAAVPSPAPERSAPTQQHHTAITTDWFNRQQLDYSPATQKRVQNWVKGGYALEAMGHYEDAIISFERAIVLDAHCVDAWQGRGIALAKLGHHEEALMSFGRVTRWQPDDYRAWQNMGRVLMSMGRHAEALSHLDRALLLKVDSYKGWYHRAIALDGLKNRWQPYPASIEPSRFVPNATMHGAPKACS